MRVHALVLLSLVSVAFVACGGRIGDDEPASDGGPPAQPGEPAQPRISDAGDAGDGDDGGDGGCPAGYSPVACNGVVLYCCAPGAHCATPSCGVPAPAPNDASEPDDAGDCPPGEILIMPCCGGYQDTSCSNGPGPPAPFCTTPPSSCDGQSECTIGGCSGPYDEATHRLSCICI